METRIAHSQVRRKENIQTRNTNAEKSRLSRESLPSRSHLRYTQINVLYSTPFDVLPRGCDTRASLPPHSPHPFCRHEGERRPLIWGETYCIPPSLFQCQDSKDLTWSCSIQFILLLDSCNLTAYYFSSKIFPSYKLLFLRHFRFFLFYEDYFHYAPTRRFSCSLSTYVYCSSFFFLQNSLILKRLYSFSSHSDLIFLCRPHLSSSSRCLLLHFFLGRRH